MSVEILPPVYKHKAYTFFMYREVRFLWAEQITTLAVIDSAYLQTNKTKINVNIDLGQSLSDFSQHGTRTVIETFISFT